MYADASGVFSSRKIAKRLEEDVAFRVLAAGHCPAHRTLRQCRRLHPAEFAAWFVPVVQRAQEAGWVKLGRVGMDDTRIKANAGKHKAMSYKRMTEREKALKAEIDALVRVAESEEKAEDCQYGAHRRGDE